MAKKKQATPLYETGISMFIYLLPVCLLLFCLLFLVLKGIGTVFYLLLICSIISFISETPTFLNMKFVLTSNKVYLFQGRKKIISWNLIGEFDSVDYRQSKLGKFFNYGDLYLGNSEGKGIVVKKIYDPIGAVDSIATQYNKLAVEIDPTYTSTYRKKDINRRTIIKDGKEIIIDRLEDKKDEE